MLGNNRHFAVAAMISLVVGFALSGPARADEPPDHQGQITIEDAWVTPANGNGRSVLHLRVVNDGHELLHLLAVETPFSEKARIVARISDHNSTTLDSIGILAESSLDLTSDHLWIELGPLTRPIKIGDRVPFTLVFIEGRVDATAHVHGVDG